MTLTDGSPRIAMLSVHTSPLDQPGTGDAGGMNVYVAELSRALAQRGAHVEIFTRATAPGLPGTTPLDDGDSRVLVRHVVAGPPEPLDKNTLPGQLCAFTAGVLRAQAASPHGYDAVHSHYWLSGQVGFLAAERWDVPLVHTAHTLALVKDASLAPGDAAEPFGRAIGEGQVVRAADALVASTPDEADVLVTDYDADPGAVHIVTPGVDLARFSPGGPGARKRSRAALGLPVNGRIVLFAGRVQPLKGPDVLVRALAAMRDAGREVPTLVVVGGPSGRPGAVRELCELAARLGVGAHVQVRPATPQRDLAAWYRAADVVAMPSHTESFGLVAAEAQACGTPVVAAAVGGLKSVVIDGVTGRLVTGHEPSAWAHALGGLLDDDGGRLELGAGAAAHADRFTWDAAASQVLKVYELAALRRESGVAA